MLINIVPRCRPDGGVVRSALRGLLGYRLSIAQLVAVAILLGTPTS
jgi:hypothetical protein